MAKFFVSVECVAEEVFDYEEIEAKDRDEAVEIAMKQAENECGFTPDDIRLVDVEQLEDDEDNELA